MGLAQSHFSLARTRARKSVTEIVTFLLQPKWNKDKTATEEAGSKTINVQNSDEPLQILHRKNKTKQSIDQTHN